MRGLFGLWKERDARWLATAVALSCLLASPSEGAAAPAIGHIEPTGSMALPRTQLVAVPLPGGRVLVAGGQTHHGPDRRPGPTVATAEIYDPVTGAFAPTGALSQRRQSSAGAALPGGRVFVAGGSDIEGFAYSSVEIHDPVAGAFAPAAPMAIPRWGAIAAALPGGRALVAGGSPAPWSFVSGSAEIYDPATNTFVPAGPMLEARRGAGAATLPDGRVLVVGGYDGTRLLASAETYDPLTGAFSPAGSTSVPLAPAAVPLADGRVMVSDGRRGTEIYDPDTGRFSAAVVPAIARRGYAMAPLPRGRVLIVGGVEGSHLLSRADVLVTAPSPQSEGLDFGQVAVGRPSQARRLIVTNLGGEDLKIGSTWLSGPGAMAFRVMNDRCRGRTLGFGRACHVILRVMPSSPGALGAFFELSDNTVDSPASFPLTAVGMQRRGRR